jgi:L-amino acid N-acyltransferase YncA
MTMLAWDGERVAGLARSTADSNFEKSECAVIIRADLRERGLARQLLQTLLRAIAMQGVREAVLNIPAGQTRMLSLSAELGFVAASSSSDALQVQTVKTLRTDAQANSS